MARKSRCHQTRRRFQVLATQLRALSTNAASQLNIFRHDGNTLGVNGAQVCVFEQSDKVCLGSFLQCEDGSRLKAQVVLEVLCDFTDKALHRQVKVLANHWEEPGRRTKGTHTWKGALRMRSSVLFWYFRISRSATVPGRYRCGLGSRNLIKTHGEIV